MKKFIVGIAVVLVISLSGCSLFMSARDRALEYAKKAATDYCKLPEMERLAIREMFKTAPNKEPFVAVTCENL